MEILALIFAGISAITAIISIVIALKAKSEVNKLKTIVQVTGLNTGVMIGEIRGGINNK